MRGTDAARRELVSWRSRHAPDASMSATVFAVGRAALLQEGFDLDPRALVIFDARRYLPRGSMTTHGNFICGLNLGFADPDDPNAIGVAMNDALASGRPLAGMTAGVAKNAVRGRRSPRTPLRATAETAIPESPRMWMAYNSIGRPMPIERLTWAAGPEDRHFGARVEPASPQALSLLINQVGGGWHLSASFHDSTFDAAAVARALERASQDPVGVLSQRVG